MTENSARSCIPLKLIAAILAAALILSLLSPSVVSLLGAAVEGKMKSGVSSDETVSETQPVVISLEKEVQAYISHYEQAAAAIAAEDYQQAAVYLETARELAADEDPAIRAEMALRSASVHILTGESEKASLLLDETLALDPEASQALLLRAQLNIDNGDGAAASEDLQAYVKLVPEDVNTGIALAELYELQGDYAGAAAQYEALYQQQTDDAHWLNSIRCTFLSGAYETALTDFDAYLDSADQGSEYYPTALFLKGACLLQTGDAQQASDAFRQALSKGYDEAECYEQLAICSFEQEDYTGTVQYGQKLEDTGAALVTPELFYQRMGAALVMLERYEEAIDYLDTAEAQEGHVTGNSYYRGVSSLALGNYDEAVENFTKSIEENFLEQFCYYNRGVCYVQLEEYEKAYSDMERTLASGNDASLTGAATDIIAQLDAYFFHQQV